MVQISSIPSAYNPETVSRPAREQEYQRPNLQGIPAATFPIGFGEPTPALVL